MKKINFILNILTIIIIPGLLFLTTLGGNFVFVDKLFGWNKFDNITNMLSSHDKDGLPVSIKSSEKVFPYLLGLIEENYPVIVGFNTANKEKILSIGAFASIPITDYGPESGKILFTPPTTRIAIDYDPSVVNPAIFGFESIPNGATYAFPIGTIQDMQSWISRYKSSREHSVTYGLSLLSIIIGTILNFKHFSKKVTC